MYLDARKKQSQKAFSILEINSLKVANISKIFGQFRSRGEIEKREPPERKFREMHEIRPIREEKYLFSDFLQTQKLSVTNLSTSFGPFSIAIWSWALRFKRETNEIGNFCFL